MSTAFTTRSFLDAISEGLTLVLMVGLTVASAATYAMNAPATETELLPERLPTVVVTAKKRITLEGVERLPTVVVTR